MTALSQIIIALIFHTLDLASGLIAAFKNKNLQSGKMRDGMFKKVGFILCYTLAFLIDTEGQAIGLNISVRILPIIIIYSVTTEIVSILENISKINPDLLPAKLYAIFQVQKEDE